MANYNYVIKSYLWGPWVILDVPNPVVDSEQSFINSWCQREKKAHWDLLLRLAI